MHSANAKVGVDHEGHTSGICYTGHAALDGCVGDAKLDLLKHPRARYMFTQVGLETQCLAVQDNFRTCVTMATIVENEHKADCY